MAAWDLCGKREQRPLMSMWGLDPNDVPISDYTIGMDAVPRMVEKMAALKWPVYKVKVGGAEDLEVLEALRAGTEAPFRVDANAAWEVEEALALLPRLTELGVELVEQPLAKGNDAGMGRLMEASSLPLIADESCVAESDVARCAGLFHGVNIKLTKCGGITPALRMIGQARALGMRVMIGSMSESTIGSSAIAHLSPLVDFLDNDGTLLLDGDVATGLQQVEGRLMPSGLPGLGVEVQAFDGDH
jgi:L-alanine-DL-glutamate epimerase-like enolase superfamily enzyme